MMTTGGDRPESVDPRQGVPPTRREVAIPATRREQDGGVLETKAEEGAVTSVPTGKQREEPHRRVLTVLPSALENRYRIVEELKGGGQARIVLVEDGASMRFIVKIYDDEAFASRTEVLERVSRAESKHVVQLIEHGTSDGRSFEVLEYCRLGTLGDLMAREGRPLPPRRVREILRELAYALVHIHSFGVDHKDLNPNNVLVRSDRPLNLVLSDFGIATSSEASVRASTFRGATYAYAPPEAFAQVQEVQEDGKAKRRVVVYATKWDYWSLGMLLVWALCGRDPFQSCDNMTIVSRLATQNVDDLAAGVADPYWRKLCRGLLRRDPQKRWGKAEVDKWLVNPKDRSLVVGEDSLPARTGFRFLGADYRTKEQLAAAFAANWTDAERIWKTRKPELDRWLRDEMGLREAAERLEVIDKAKDLNLDRQLFEAIHALDSSAPLSFRGIALTEEKLKALADRAPTDAQASDVLRRLYTGRILDAADKLSAN